MLTEKKYISSNDVVLKYYQKQRKYDFNHVIFVFSGFLNQKPGNYDFLNALKDCPAEVVWISDDFENMYTYYMCMDMDFKVEYAVIEFVENYIKEIGLKYSDITFTGFSKGGSAALYLGLKYNVSNIVITVPQINVGSYVHNNWKHVATHMMGENYTKSSVDHLDRLIKKEILTDRNLKRNIYLLTSESDDQYFTEIHPILDSLSKYSNFNLLKTFSSFVRAHNQVTAHHTSLLLSIYYALSNSAPPRFGEVNFFGNVSHTKSLKNNEPYVQLRKVSILENRFFLEGVGIIRNINLEAYDDINYELIFHSVSDNKETSLKIAKDNKPGLTRELFEGNFIVYDKGWFTTTHYKGLDCAIIPKGVYKLFLKIITNLKTDIVQLPDNSKLNCNLENKFYKLTSENGFLIFIVK